VRRSLVALAVVDLLVLAAAIAGAANVGPSTRSTTATGGTGAVSAPLEAGGSVPRLAAPRTVTAALVRDRPWPDRVTPSAAWTAALDGVGNRVTLTAVAGVVPGGLGQATLKLASADPRGHAPSDNVNLTLPDGTKWYPLDPFRLDATGDLPFTSAVAHDGAVTLTVASLPATLVGAPDPVVAVGRFVSADGREVDRLALPRATRVGRDCPNATCPVVPDAPAVALPARPATVLRGSTSARSGEAAVAGSARAQALGRRWDGLVGAVEGTDMTATATWDGRSWSLAAAARGARQVWVDVWPVADTTLAASSSVNDDLHNCLRNCDLRLRWTNTGFATSQIYEAEAVGPAGRSIGFDLNKSLGHDAGLGVGRGDRKVNLGGGGDVDSNQAPGEKVDRGLSYTPGADVTLVLRGNFADVRVHLAIPAA
jgi:hypothetical protein